MIGVEAAILFGQFRRETAHDLVGGEAQGLVASLAARRGVHAEEFPRAGGNLRAAEPLQVLDDEAVFCPRQRDGQDGIAAPAGEECHAHFGFLQGLRFGARPFGRDDHQPALFHTRQNFAEGGMVRLETVQPDDVHRAADGAEQGMVFVFLGDGHDDVFALHRVEQDGCVQPPEVIGRQDKVSLGKFVKPDHFHIGDEVHDEADDGSDGFIFHAPDFNVETYFFLPDTFLTFTSEFDARELRFSFDSLALPIFQDGVELFKNSCRSEP